jgi:ABC-type xylose transport system substrate-binding protein
MTRCLRITYSTTAAIMRVFVWLLLVCTMCAAHAQQPAAKDRNAFVIEAMTSQRDRAQADAAACYADASVMIAKLQAEIAELKAPKQDAPAVK